MDKIRSNFELYKEYIKKQLDKLEDETSLNEIISNINLKHDSNIFIIGNGGSAANASHFAQDLVKGTFLEKHGLRDTTTPSIKAMSLCDNTSFITATANDDGYQYIFTNQLKSLATPGKDILIIISGSGNSENVINAAQWAIKNNILVISFTGFDGGIVKRLSDINFNVNLDDMLAVETIHSFMFHYIIEQIKYLRYENV